MTLKTFVFFDASSTAAESNVFSVLEGAEDMTLHVTGSSTVNLTIKGKTDDQGNWEDIAAISMDSFKVAESITSSGIYSVPLHGLVQLKIINSGATGVKVYGRIMA